MWKVLSFLKSVMINLLEKTKYRSLIKKSMMQCLEDLPEREEDGKEAKEGIQNGSQGFGCAKGDKETQTNSIRAEIHHLLSPLVAVREQMFTRTCYSMGNQSWLVVDLPTRLMDISSNSRWQLPFIRSCLVSPYTTQSASNVIWIEMTQFLLDEVHPLYHHLCGQLFSSERGFRTLTEEGCRRAPAALEKLVTLAKEMSARFYSGLSAATPHFKIQACALREVSFAMDADCLFNVVRSLDSLGQTLLEIPSIEETNCVSLHLGTDGNRVVREICFDNSGSSMLVTSEDVITSVRALSIDSHEDTSFLTVTYVMHPVSSSSQAQQNWMKEFSDKICNIIQDIELKTLV
ncbi:hypothetical protein Bca4012_091697 [Brassica carinata]|uniref:START domain-containing protein n=1 Tax=Brassica carinata TaxID=52824 RepID=A0A8X7PQ82_BRACI|nr:hypothetical protein Bca52824_074427 [Brassica carinata]